MKSLLASGQDLVGIGLVANIPDDLIIRCIENIMDGDSQFNGSKTGTQVARIGGDDIEDKLADLIAKFRQLVSIQFFKIRRILNRIKQISSLCHYQRVVKRGAKLRNPQLGSKKSVYRFYANIQVNFPAL